MGLDNELSRERGGLVSGGGVVGQRLLVQEAGVVPDQDPVHRRFDRQWRQPHDRARRRFGAPVQAASESRDQSLLITDEVRYGWKFVHSEDRINMPSVAGMDPWADEHANEAWMTALTTAAETLRGKKLGVVLSPMLPSEEAFRIAEAAQALGQEVVFGLGPVPTYGEDKTFKDGFVLRAEKAPNARGVRAAVGTLGTVHEWDQFLGAVDRVRSPFGDRQLPKCLV